MKALLVDGRERADIDAQVEKVLRGLGHPEPPLRLEDIRELLKLDFQYYSSTDDNVLREVVSRVKVGAKQLFLRPTLLLDIVRKADLSALWVPDRQRILIDRELPQIKHRWAECHEISHSLIEWHKAFLFGDSTKELSLSCRATLEAEANYGAGQLLFLRERFKSEAQDLPMNLSSIKQLSSRYRNTMTCTLWRYIEQLGDSLPMLGLVTPHPRRLPDGHNPLAPCKYFIQSSAFRERFSSVSEQDAFSCLSYCRNARGGTLGEDEVVLNDVNGEEHLFHFETFFNQYEALTLAYHLRASRTQVSVIGF